MRLLTSFIGKNSEFKTWLKRSSDTDRLIEIAKTIDTLEMEGALLGALGFYRNTVHLIDRQALDKVPGALIVKTRHCADYPQELSKHYKGHRFFVIEEEEEEEKHETINAEA